MTDPGKAAVTDFVQNCPFCGAACSGTYRFVPLDQSGVRGLEVDCPTFREILTIPLDEAVANDAYDDLPAFLRDWNEDTGWNDFDTDSAVISGDELSAVVDFLLEFHRAAERRVLDILIALASLSSPDGTGVRRIRITTG